LYFLAFYIVFIMADITDDSDVVNPWVESDTEPDYIPWEPKFPSTAWGRLNEAGWYGGESPSRLERRRIVVLIAVRNHFFGARSGGDVGGWRAGTEG
jgi:hypothetical protein